MVSRKCAGCEHFGRYEWFDPESNMTITEKRIRNWKGCRRHLKPSICSIEEERVRDDMFE